MQFEAQHLDKIEEARRQNDERKHVIEQIKQKADEVVLKEQTLMQQQATMQQTET